MDELNTRIQEALNKATSFAFQPNRNRQREGYLVRFDNRQDAEQLGYFLTEINTKFGATVSLSIMMDIDDAQCKVMISAQTPNGEEWVDTIKYLDADYSNVDLARYEENIDVHGNSPILICQYKNGNTYTSIDPTVFEPVPVIPAV